MEKLKTGKIYLEKSYERLRDDPKIILLHIAALLFSFTVSHAKIGFDISPFGIALCAAAPGELLFSCFLGQAFGYASSQSIIGAARYILSSILIRLILFKASKRQSEYKRIWFLPPLCVLVVCLAGGLIASAFVQMSLKAFFAVLAESAAAAAATYFFKQSFDFLDNAENMSDFSPRQFVCLVFSSGIFLLTLSSFNFYEVSLSKILAGFLVLMFAYSGGEIASCIAGVVGGLSVGIYSGSAADIISLSLSGALAGVFSPLGSAGCVATFLLCRFACFFFTSQNSGLFALMAECAASVTIFLAMPKNISLDFLKSTVLPKEEKSGVFISKKSACEKMLKASECIGEISESVDKVSTHLRRLNESNLKAIYCRVQADVCGKCKRYDYCTDKNFRSTYMYFEQISKLFDENERVTKNDLPKRFVSLCSDADKFLESFEKHYRRHRELLQSEKEIESVRKAFRDRLNCEKDILLKFSKDFSREKISDEKTASAIKNLMRNLGIRVQSVRCVVDEKGVMNIKAVCKSFESTSGRDKLKKDIEDITLRRFEAPKVSYLESGIEVEMEQKPWISASTGLVRIPSRGASLCGDNCETFTQSGVLCVVLSDGMGTGGRAAVDSALCAEFFKKLILSGFSEDTALKTVNSCMLVKSSYESLSTIDYAKIDLFTGKAQIFKAGAAASVIRKSGKAMSLEDASLPVGILGDIEFSQENICLSPGDILLMMSDGATANGTKWIEEELEKYNRNNAEELARSIALSALDRSSLSKQDDVTVFAAILQ